MAAGLWTQSVKNHKLMSSAEGILHPCFQVQGAVLVVSKDTVLHSLGRIIRGRLRFISNSDTGIHLEVLACLKTTHLT